MPQKHCFLLAEPVELGAGMGYHIPTVVAVVKLGEEVTEVEAPWRHVGELDGEGEVRSLGVDFHNLVAAFSNNVILV